MLTAIKVRNPSGAVLELPMNGSSEYLVKGITGLGPVKANILTVEFVDVDGGSFQGSRGNMRNVVMLLGYNPTYLSDDPFGSLRRGLYPWFTTEAPVELQFVSDNFETLRVNGYVEDMIPSMFTAEPEIQISILCPDPYLYPLAKTGFTKNGSGSFTINNPGHVRIGIDVLMENQFSVKGGTEFDFIRTSPKGNVMSYDGFRFPTTSVVRIVTVPGKKEALYKDQNEYFNRNPNGTKPFTGQKNGWRNVLGYLTGWMTLEPGPNTFTVIMAPKGIANFSYLPKYQGL